MDDVFLGDGVYVATRIDGIVLKANSHTEPTDVIFLEHSVMEALIGYYTNLIDELIKREKDGN